MHYKTFLVLSYLILLAVLVSAPLVVLVNTPLSIQSNPTDLNEVTHMKAGHQKAAGVVSEVNSSLSTVKTATGSTLTLTESAAAREGHQAPHVGDH